MNNFELWFEEFKKGWEVRVIENEHLLKICFLEFLSTINKVRYVYGGQYKTVNLSSFKVQQSGTGKGVGDGYVHDLLRYLGYKVCKINSFTEAGIIGSLNTNNKGESTIIKGALGEYDFIWIDEGKNLIIGNQWSQGLLETINGYLDDGRIFKRLKNGNIEYWSNCNFATGTFFFSKLKPAVLTTGIFQRSLFSYKYYSKDDVLRISKKYDELACKNYILDLLPVFDTLKEMKKKLSFEKYNITGSEHKNYVIRMNYETSIKFGELIDDYFNTYIFNQVKDDRLKDILTSFLIRYKDLGHKIMCLYSVWNNKDTIDNDSIDYAFTTVKDLLSYVLDFISDAFEDNKFNMEDLNNEDSKNKNIIKTKRTLLEVIKKYPGISKSALKDYILKHSHLFFVGENKIKNSILPSLIKDGLVDVKIEKHNEHKLYLIE